MMEALGTIALIFLLGLAGTGILFAYVVNFPRLQNWVNAKNGEGVSKRGIAYLLYFLSLIFTIGFLIFSTLKYYLDFI